LILGKYTYGFLLQSRSGKSQKPFTAMPSREMGHEKKCRIEPRSKGRMKKIFRQTVGCGRDYAE